MTYNGWTNWETWNVSLWVENDETTYRAMIKARPFRTDDEVREFVEEWFPDGTPDMDHEDELQAVNWAEVRESFNEGVNFDEDE